MGKLLLTLLCLSMNINLCFGAFTKDDSGASTAQFLKLGVSARAAGMGDAYAGIADDSTAIYWNPAGLHQIQGPTASALYASWFEDIAYGWLSYAQPFKGGGLGLGVQYLSYGDIPHTDEDGTEIKTLKPNDMAVSVAYGRKIGNFAFGMGAKYISSRINQSASAVAGDIGWMYRKRYRKRASANNRETDAGKSKYSFGLAVQNLGTKMKFVDKKETLPTNIKFGSMYQVVKNWLFALDVNAPVDNGMNFGLGTEYKYKLEGLPIMAGRVGYNTRTRNVDGFSGFTFGVGFRHGPFTLEASDMVLHFLERSTEGISGDNFNGVYRTEANLLSLNLGYRF